MMILERKLMELEVTNCFIHCKKDGINPFLPDENGLVKIDDFAILPLEDFKKFCAKMGVTDYTMWDK